MIKLLKIRHNNEHEGSDLRWRVLLGEKEYLATEIIINVPCYTTCDLLKDGRTKYHITANYEKISWVGNKLIVE